MSDAAFRFGGIPLEHGTVLAKKYRLEGRIGEGGTGIVMMAHHLLLEQRVAIKFLRAALATDEVRTRFEREARAIGEIQSEHVVLVLDYGLHDGAPFMVMEFLEGRDLARVLKEDGPLSIEDAVDCMLQACQALGQAHAAGIVHRDLKPANLFLTRKDNGAPHVKVVDFGISKVVNKKAVNPDAVQREVTGAFTVLGSARYMAPEQLKNSRDVDARADLWSVGAVLFQLVTGKHAFEAASNIEAGIKVISGEPTKLRELAPDAPAALEAIVSRCLTKDVEARFQTAEELALALREFGSERTRQSLDDESSAQEATSLELALLVKPPTDSSDGEPAAIAISGHQLVAKQAGPSSPLRTRTDPLPFAPSGALRASSPMTPTGYVQTRASRPQIPSSPATPSGYVAPPAFTPPHGTSPSGRPLPPPASLRPPETTPAPLRTLVVAGGILAVVALLCFGAAEIALRRHHRPAGTTVPLDARGAPP